MATDGSNSPQRLLIPMKVDAFILNKKVCSGGPNDAKIAPLSRPDYTGLRPESKTIKSDVFPNVNLGYSTPHNRNQRITDIGNGMTRENRCGVYLTWLLPRVYRMGSMASESAAEWQEDNLRKAGYRVPKDRQRPVFRQLPVRWLVVRHLKDPQDGAPEFYGWIIEGDRQRSLQELVEEGADVDIEATPYLHIPKGQDASSFNLVAQADVFTGYKANLGEWEEVGDAVPRADLTLLHTSNEYLADFQPHNANVFSMLDNFEYIHSYGYSKKMDGAVASYYVIGWHADNEQDPFHLTADVKTTLGDRLAACGMKLKDSNTEDAQTWSAMSKSTQILCHGALYDVKYTDESPPPAIPANDSALFLSKRMPVAFGTTELDALLAYVRAHQEDSISKEVEKNIEAIQSLLFAQDDGVDAQLEAEDEVYNHNFSRRSGGGVFRLTEADGKDDQGASASHLTNSQQEQLRKLNLIQEDLDLCVRTQQQLQWSLFAAWWKCVTDPERNEVNKVDALAKRLQKLATTISHLQNQVTTKRTSLAQLTKKALQLSPRAEFYQPRDPTLAIGGVSSAWPHDFLQLLEVRLESQITEGSTIDAEFQKLVEQKLPNSIKHAATSLLKEFVGLKSEDTYGSANGQGQLPLYHDVDVNPSMVGQHRDRWNNRQPWFPLFIEWEAEYWHIPIDKWDLGERIDRSGKTVTAFGIRSDINLAEYEEDQVKQNKGLDKRRISGRISILPQVGHSLATKIQQLFDHTPASVLDNTLTSEERDELLKQSQRLQFLSTPLRGIIDHLLTRSHGTHVSPNIWRIEDSTWQPVAGAAIDAQGFMTNVLQLMGQQTSMVPYGSEYSLDELKYCPFKPCTHGQLRFRKLNIIDRFGQGIHALDPDEREVEPELYPCASEFYACQPVHGHPDQPNTVIKAADDGGCQFVQLPPQINQYARLNGHFILHDPTDTDSQHSYWRPCSEWEDPIWGWLLVNCINRSIQIFQPDGNFYGEVRLGGPTGSQVAPWLPSRPAQRDNTQLDFLISRMRDSNYALALIEVLEQALDRKPTTPHSYAQSLASSIGRPLALVNTGWDLELAVAAELNHSTGNDYTSPEKGLATYRFGLKLGDGDRAYDGLMGFFPLHERPQEDGSTADLSTMYTYYPAQTNSGNPTKKIDHTSYGHLKPLYIRPDAEDTFDPVPAADLANRRNKKMLGYAMLIDPFRAVHGYTGILPSYGLKLPGWIWKAAVDRICTILSVGPLLEVSDPPAYDTAYRLEKQDQIKTYPKERLPNGGVTVPAPPTVDDWVWLQPYAVPEEKEEEEEPGADGENVGTTAFMCLPVGKKDNRPRLEPGPYTMVEGQLLLRKTTA